MHYMNNMVVVPIVDHEYNYDYMLRFIAALHVG